MPSEYDPSSAYAQDPSPAPSPGSGVALDLPVDADSANAASVYQPLKALADGLNDTRQSVRTRAPQEQGSVAGFTAVVHTGTGVGTVTPSAISTSLAQPSNWGGSVVVKITLAGAVATAKFRWSNDGGLTYETEQTTAATYTDGTSGIKVAFSGTFGLGDTYQFYGADCPQVQTADTDGNVRSVVDHNGFAMGRQGQFREDWQTLLAVTGAYTSDPTSPDAFTQGYSRWKLVQTANAAVSTGSPSDAVLNSTGLIVDPGSANGNSVNLYTPQPFILQNVNSSVIAEWAVSLSAIGSTNVNWYFGINGSTAGLLKNAALFQYTSGASVWSVVTADNALATTTTATATVPIAGLTQRFRVELHGAGSPYGAKARFFIETKLVNETTTHMPLAGNATGFAIIGALVGSATATAFVGPLKIAWNQFANLESL